MTSNWQLQCHRSIPTLTGTGPDPAGKSNLWWLSHHISGFYLWATVYRPPGATLSLCFPFNSGLNPSQGAAPPKGSSRLFNFARLRGRVPYWEWVGAGEQGTVPFEMPMGSPWRKTNSEERFLLFLHVRVGWGSSVISYTENLYGKSTLFTWQVLVQIMKSDFKIRFWGDKYLFTQITPY